MSRHGFYGLANWLHGPESLTGRQPGTEQEACSWLELLYPKKEITKQADFDIVFVAGLGGHYLRTWQAPSDPPPVEDTVWPRDMLPPHIPNIRVRSFQYNTSLKGAASNLGIRQHADDLLVRLADDREDDEAAALRPVIFVGHSLGGMIIKRALKRARDFRDSGGNEETTSSDADQVVSPGQGGEFRNGRSGPRRYRLIWEATRGVMFFATPHLGLSKTVWRQFATFVLGHDAPTKGTLPTRDMVKALKASGDALYSITEDFRPLHHDMSFVTFVEENPMKGLTVRMTDEVLGRMHAHSEHIQPLSGDHLSICKFRKSQEAEFSVVWTNLRSLMNAKPRLLDRVDPEAKRALHSLCTDKFHGFFLAKEPTEDTCRWIAERLEFKDFVENRPMAGKRAQRLWIQGEYGCGKSFLAARIITDLIPENQQDGVIHCFLSGSSPERGNVEALLRSTLHQALRLEPEAVVKYLLGHFKESQARDVHIEKIWTREKLILLWPVIMAFVMDRHPLILVIDGLGEIATRCQRDFVGCLEKLEEQTQHTKNLRVLVVSGESDILGEGLKECGFKAYKVTPQDTASDVARSTNARLGHLWRLESLRDEKKQKDICDNIAQNAKGNYLWASLAAENLRHTLVSDADELTRALGNLPPTVEGLYERILEQTLRDHQREAFFIRQVLTWAMYQQEGLKVAEFNIVQAIGQAANEHPDQPITKDNLEELLEPNIQAKVNFYCGQLVRFIDGRLELIHPSLKSYLTTATTSHLGRGFALDETTSNADLARVCIAYLTMGTFGDAGQSLETLELTSWESKVRKRIQLNDFVRYASLYWYKHVAEAGDDWRETRKQKLLEDSSTSFGQNWTEVWWFLTRGPSQTYPVGFLADKLVEAARVVEVETVEEAEVEESEPESVPDRGLVDTGQSSAAATDKLALRPPRPAENFLQNQTDISPKWWRKNSDTISREELHQPPLTPSSAKLPQAPQHQPPLNGNNNQQETRIEYREVIKYIPLQPAPAPEPVTIPVPVAESKPEPEPEEKLGYFKRVTKATKKLVREIVNVHDDPQKVKTDKEKTKTKGKGKKK